MIQYTFDMQAYGKRSQLKARLSARSSGPTARGWSTDWVPPGTPINFPARRGRIDATQIHSDYCDGCHSGRTDCHLVAAENPICR